jgi:Dyp-type peroxidase family
MPINLNKPLDDTAISNTEKGFMQNLQANILKGHGREHVILMFLSIKNVAKARTYLRNYDVTDAHTQFIETQNFQQSREPGGVVRLVFLSKTGLDTFGHAPKFNTFGAFAGGMAGDAGVLDDGTTASWQNELKQPYHVMLLVAYHDEVALSRIVGKMKDDFDDAASGFDVVFVQEGSALKNADKEGIEHFGYVDGRSQPLMLKSAIDKEASMPGGGIDKYNPTAPLGQFMLPDPLNAAGVAGFGSFFVFRKLEQNVAQFKRAEADLANDLGLVGDDKERAGALVVGRFEDGTPVTLHNTEKGVPVVNNFDYSADAAGAKCPFHAHIRKSHPRGSSPGGLDFDKSVQMARRGITYGARVQDVDTANLVDSPNDGVGLLFMSYQASIEKQFQFMQTQWVNNEGFPSAGVGIDPVIGQTGNLPQTWKGATGPVQKLFKGFVILKGGEYFYTPSLNGLKSI